MKMIDIYNHLLVPIQNIACIIGDKGSIRRLA